MTVMTINVPFLPGDSCQVHNGHQWIPGKVSEVFPYIYSETNYHMRYRVQTRFPIVTHKRNFMNIGENQIKPA